MANRDTRVNAPGGPGVSDGSVRKDINKPAEFGAPAPFVDDRVADPAARRYAAAADSRRRQPQAIPRYTQAVAYGPDVPIPRLDGEHVTGLTMAEQAALGRPQGAGSEPPPMPAFGGPGWASTADSLPTPAGIIEGQAHHHVAQAAPHAPGRAGALPPGILAGDLLPEQATRDPAFQGGQGSMYAANQPAMALKYGVVRRGQLIPPQALNAVAGGAKKATLKPETLEGLEALRQFNEQKTSVESGEDAVDKQIAEDARRGPAGASSGTEKPLSDEQKKELISGMDEFDLGRIRSALFKDLLNNEEEKKAIESRLKPLNLTDLIVTRRVTQVVPIVPGVFEPEFQSYAGGEDLEIRRMIFEENQSFGRSEEYLVQKYTLMGLTIAVRAINKKPLPNYLDAAGEFDEAAFQKKLRFISQLDFHMLSSLQANWFWFDLRVRSLFKASSLGNG